MQICISLQGAVGLGLVYVFAYGNGSILNTMYVIESVVTCSEIRPRYRI